jgi:hypothetical protein
VLLQKDQPGGPGNSAVTDHALKYDGNLAAQQNTGAASDFVQDRTE